MIYVKSNNSTITENLFVAKDEYYQFDKRNVLYEKYFNESRGFSPNIVAKELFDEMKSGEDDLYKSSFSSYALFNDMICGKDVLSDLEEIMNSNLTNDIKVKYIKQIRDFYSFGTFCTTIYPLFSLEILSSYKMNDLKYAREVCDKAGVYTTASEIITPRNIEIAEDNAKVLSLVKKFRRFNTENKVI